MSRYLCTLRYDGASFCGWQVQKNGPSVCAAVGDALHTLLRERVNVTGCGRTDAGVHALRYSFHFDTAAAFDRRRFLAGLNALLPDTVAALGVDPVPDAFHARYSALGKSYIYKIWNAPYMDPFLRGRAYHCPGPLDLSSMREAARAFLGAHDFRAFMASGSSVTDTVREIFRLDAAADGPLVTVFVAGSGFLYRMVHSIAGTLLDTARGRISPQAVPALIQNGDRSAVGMTLPACGLYFNEAYYEKEQIDKLLISPH